MDGIEFCKNRIKSFGLDINTSDFQELNTEEYLKNNYNISLPVSLEVKEMNISGVLGYNKDFDFDYFTSSSSVHDGTILFVYENINKCIQNLLKLQSYNKNLNPPTENSKIEYTIGNIIIFNEYGDKFSTKEKPWCRTRTTVMIPIKYRIDLL